MTTAHHAPNLLTSSSSQSSLLDNPTHSTTTPTPDSLNATVSSIVDDIVETAVSTASIQAEKRNVQALINKLVSQVRDDAVNTAKPRSIPPNPNNVEKQTPFRGVAIGDHRQRRCRKLPVTWTQAMDSVTLNVDVPPWVRKQQVSVSFTPGSVKTAVHDNSSSAQTVLFDEPLVAEIAVDGCLWALEEEGSAKKLIIEIEKARMQWWARLFMSDDPAEYTIVNPRDISRPTDVSSVGTSLPRDNEVTRGGPIARASHEYPSSQRAEREEDPGKPSGSNLQDSVAAFVDEVVEAAASRSPDVSNQSSSNSAAGEGMKEQSTLRQQRVLTRADIPKMVEQCKMVFANGGARASESALQLATFYHHGLGVEQNDAEAARLYKYALENGILDPSAAFQLGLIYNQGAPGLEANPTEAVRWWRVSASLRNPVAMFNLGVMYMNGSGCDMDPIMATRWFQQAQALDPRLQPPQFSRAQLEERIATAMKLKKQRLKRALPPEEKQRRKEEALQKVRVLAYGSAAIVGLGVSMVALRYWWRNRL